MKSIFSESEIKFNLLQYTLLITVFIGLSGCGGSGGSSKESINQSVAHGIQPEDVAKFVSTYENTVGLQTLEFDGNTFGLEYVDSQEDADDPDNNYFLFKYGSGLVQLFFNFEDEEPVATVILREGNISNLQNFTPTRILISQPGTITTNDLSAFGSEGVEYNGTVTDVTSPGTQLFQFRAIFYEAALGGGDSEIVVNGDSATITAGDLGTKTYIQIRDLIANKPLVDTLVLQTIDGSVNDDINVHTGRLIRNAGLTTLVPADGDIASGGVDLFASGSNRIYTNGGIVGVHSWCCEDGEPASELGRSHEAHAIQLTYFREMLGKEKGEQFYFFTIESADFDDIHNMTVEEMQNHSLVTSIVP